MISTEVIRSAIAINSKQCSLWPKNKKNEVELSTDLSEKIDVITPEFRPAKSAK